jgi:hypothetical protein
MSADLFAEFGADPPPNQQQSQPAAATRTSAPAVSDFNFFNDLGNNPTLATRSQQPSSANNGWNSASKPEQESSLEDNDDWGDFEGGSSFEPAPAAKQDPFAFTSPPVSQPQLNAWNITQTTHDPFAFVSQPSSQPEEQTWSRAPIVKAKKSADPSVLFDAEDVDEDDDDDFGDFEGEQDSKVQPTVPKAPSLGLVDLLGDTRVSQSQTPATSSKNATSGNQVSKFQATANKNPKTGFGTVSKTKQPTPVVTSAENEGDGWDEFDDWEASIPAKASNKSESIQSARKAESTTTLAPVLSPTTPDPQPGELPPTNVPPPGVLLSLFPSLFAEAQEKLFKPMAAQPLPMRNKLLAEPATIAYLQGYLMLANVAAHIIAGRKLRWKRDQHLSQGMRIGPASSRATSGMKLAGIDKGENMKEEREVSDVVRSWKEQVGRLRHVVSGANQIKAGTLDRGPDVQETMAVKTLKQSEGGIPARQPCMLCGLKREERVTAADMATDDSFGEWWIDQVNMHRGMFIRRLW